MGARPLEGQEATRVSTCSGRRIDGADHLGSGLRDEGFAARESWNEVLNRIQVTGGSDTDLEKFYTALYHVFQSPNVASDVNGEYMGFDQDVHTAGGVRYQNYSGWDIIRSWTTWSLGSTR
jgi:hypothetical protein